VRSTRRGAGHRLRFKAEQPEEGKKAMEEARVTGQTVKLRRQYPAGLFDLSRVGIRRLDL
jgi:hypothetical protein